MQQSFPVREDMLKARDHLCLGFFVPVNTERACAFFHQILDRYRIPLFFHSYQERHIIIGLDVRLDND